MFGHVVRVEADPSWCSVQTNVAGKQRGDIPHFELLVGLPSFLISNSLQMSLISILRFIDHCSLFFIFSLTSARLPQTTLLIFKSNFFKVFAFKKRLNQTIQQLSRETVAFYCSL